MEYQQSFCSHSTTLIKVIPIGNIPLVVFNKYLTSLVDHCAIPVCEYPNILRLPNFSYYSDILWEKGMISISFITDDTFLSKDTSTPYDSFFPHLRTAGVIGIYDTTFGLSKEEALSEFENLCSNFPKVTIKQALIFDMNKTDKSREYNENVTAFHRLKAGIDSAIPKYEGSFSFPTLIREIQTSHNYSGDQILYEEQDIYESYIESIHHYCVYLGYLIFCHFNKLLNDMSSNYICLPNEYQLTQNLTLLQSRRNLFKAGIFLLIGDYLSSQSIYRAEYTRCQQNNDSMGVCASLEGFIATSIMEYIYKYIFNTTVSSFVESLFYKNIQECYILYLSKGQPNLAAMFLLKACQLYASTSISLVAYFHHHSSTQPKSPTLSILPSTKEIRRKLMTLLKDLTSIPVDHYSMVYVYLNMSLIYYHIGFQRKFIYYLCQAIQYIDESSSSTLIFQLYNYLYQFLHIPMSLTSLQSLPSSSYQGQVWLSVQYLLLDKSEKMMILSKNYNLYVYLLVNMLSTIYKLQDITEEYMQKTFTILQAYSSYLPEGFDCTCPFPIILNSIQYIPLASYLLPIYEDSRASPFMYCPTFGGPRKPIHRCVCKESVSLSISLYNPFPFKIPISQIRLDYTEGKVHTDKGMMIELLPHETKEYIFTFTPLEAGSFIIQSCRVNIFGIWYPLVKSKNHTPITCIPFFSRTNGIVEVSPSLPLLLPLSSSTPSPSESYVYLGQMIQNTYRVQIVSEEVSTIAIDIRLLRGVKDNQNKIIFDDPSVSSIKQEFIINEEWVHSYASRKKDFFHVSLPPSSKHPSSYQMNSTIFLNTKDLFESCKEMPLAVGTLMDFKYHIYILEPIQVEIKISYSNKKNPSLKRELYYHHRYYPIEQFLVQKIDICPLPSALPPTAPSETSLQQDTTSPIAHVLAYLPETTQTPYESPELNQVRSQTLSTRMIQHQQSTITSFLSQSSQSLTYLLCIPVRYIFTEEECQRYNSQIYTYKSIQFLHRFDPKQVPLKVLESLYQYIHFFASMLEMKYKDPAIHQYTYSYIIYDKKTKQSTSHDLFDFHFYRQPMESLHCNTLSLESFFCQSTFIYIFNNQDITIHSISNLPVSSSSHSFFSLPPVTLSCSVSSSAMHCSVRNTKMTSKSFHGQEVFYHEDVYSNINSPFYSFYYEYAISCHESVTIHFAVDTYELEPAEGVLQLQCTNSAGTTLLTNSSSSHEMMFTGSLTKQWTKISSSSLPSHSVTFYFLTPGNYTLYPSLVLPSYHIQYWYKTPIVIHVH